MVCTNDRTQADQYHDRVQVNIPAESGEMGILAQHVPSIEQLKPGLIEVIEEAGGSKQFFCTESRHLARRTKNRAHDFSTVSGGFAVVQPNSQLSINAVEGFPLEDFSAEVYPGPSTDLSLCSYENIQAVRNGISEAQKIASGGGSEQDIAEAKIELEVNPIPVRITTRADTLRRSWRVFKRQ